MNLKGMKSSNPAMAKMEEQALSLGPVDELIVDDSQRMTLEGTINKIGIMLTVIFATGFVGWQMFATNPAKAYPIAVAGMFIALIAALVTIFKPNFAKVGSMIYSPAKGFTLGVFSASFEMRYPGIVVQAVFLTFTITFSMLYLYKSGIIRATPMFKKVVITAGLGIFAFYMISLVAYFGFGVQFSYFQTENASALSIGMSFVFAAVAALFLILDFDLIENATNSNMPKNYEWYGAFTLLLTLVWLYIEVLRLLAKLRD